MKHTWTKLKKDLKKWFGVAKLQYNIPRYASLTFILISSVCVFAPTSFAQEEKLLEASGAEQTLEQKTTDTKKTTTPIIALGNDFQNSIEFLNNRFRVDNDVEEVTMVFFREDGSAPIVLVRPDGSKLFIENDDDDPDMRWYETQKYDMISIKKPMPGPWQAIGEILEGSKIMVIADIVLDAQPIPRNIYSGEIIKQTAVLTNNGKQVDFSPFRDVVSLTIDFVSNNNPNYENFGLGSRTIARFQDNGEGFDEAAADGVFTGQFNLSIPSGEWRPTFGIRTPMYTREQKNDLVILHPTPIFINVKIDETNAEIADGTSNESTDETDDETIYGEHIITVDTDAEHIKLDSLLLDGKVTHPNGEIDNVTITEINNSVKMIRVKNDSYGIYRIKLTAFATTVDDREVIINVPEYTFLTSEPEEPEPEIDESQGVVISAAPIVIEPEKDAWTATNTVSLIIAINSCIFVFGGMVIFLILNKRKYPNDHIMLRYKMAWLELLAKIKNLKKTKSDEEIEKLGE
jgi:hypothetical protein